MTKRIAPGRTGTTTMNTQSLSTTFRAAHDAMRNADGVQPHEAFDELLKYVFVRQHALGVTGVGLFASSDTPDIRQLFSDSLTSQSSIEAKTWGRDGVRLSDRALAAVHGQLAGVDFSSLGMDVHAAALRDFLGPEVRRGLGIYLTPDEVVRVAVEVLNPPRGSVVYDPCCGSGTFLSAVLAHWGGPYGTLVGSDVSERMAFLTELSFGRQAHALRVNVQDSMTVTSPPAGLPPEGADFILTNPPFGVQVDRVTANKLGLQVVDGQAGNTPAEVILLERCIRWLRPGGRAAIVIPRSVITNVRLNGARKAIDGMATLLGVVNLPPETFAMTGTQTNTAILIFEKAAEAGREGVMVNVPVLDVRNVGFDNTGRSRAGSELPAVSATLRAALTSPALPAAATFRRLPAGARLAGLGITQPAEVNEGRRPLAEFIELADTGKTPGRADYVSDGAFIVKVGNLTGRGIDWCPRDRNFVPTGTVKDKRCLLLGDVVLTSSAHHPRYIAEKVDVVGEPPPFVSQPVTFVGEVMRLRPKKGVDPFWLLGLIRHPLVKAEMRQLIRGQTAHLNPKMVLALSVPEAAFPDERLIAVLREEAKLTERLNLVAKAQREIYGAPPDDEND